MIYIVIITPLVILYLAIVFYSKKLLHYVCAFHPKFIKRPFEIKICADAKQLLKVGDEKLIGICKKREILIRLFIGYAGIAFMLIVFYWIYLILEK